MPGGSGRATASTTACRSSSTRRTSSAGDAVPEGTPSFTRDDRSPPPASTSTSTGSRAYSRPGAARRGGRRWTVRTAAGTEWKARTSRAVGTLGLPNFPKQVTDALAKFKGDVVRLTATTAPSLPGPARRARVRRVERGDRAGPARNGKCASVKLVAPPNQADGQRFGQDWCPRACSPARAHASARRARAARAARWRRATRWRAAMKETTPSTPSASRPSCARRAPSTASPSTLGWTGAARRPRHRLGRAESASPTAGSRTPATSAGATRAT